MKTTIKTPVMPHPSFVALVHQLVSRRQDLLNSLVAGKSMITLQITAHNGRKLGGVTLIAGYVSHNQETITVDSSVEILDHVLHNMPITFSNPMTAKRITFRLVDVTIGAC